MPYNGSASNATSDFGGVQNVFRIPSVGAGTPSGLITPNVNGVARTCRFYWVLGLLTNTYPVYLRLYDTAVAPTPGAGTPKITFPFASSTYWNGTIAVAAPQPNEFNLSDIGCSFTQGIGYVITKLPADTDTTAILAGDLTGLNIGWQ